MSDAGSSSSSSGDENDDNVQEEQPEPVQKEKSTPEKKANNDVETSQTSSRDSRERDRDSRDRDRGSSYSSSSRRDGPPGTKLYVGNLPDSCKRSELQDLFEKCGPIDKCDVLRNFAFVHFEKPSDASKAVEKLDDSEFLGVHIQVQHARSKGRPTANDDQCFECGREGHWARDCPRRRGRGPPSRGPPPRSSRGPDSSRSYDSYRGYRDQYRDDYSSSRYSGQSRYGSSSYGGYGARARSRSPPRSYHSAYAYPQRW